MQEHNIQIVYKEVKYINLKVRPNQEVVLTVPLNTTDKEIKYICNKKHSWIYRQLQLFSKNKPSKKELVSGESFVYLGRTYRLKIIESDNERVKLGRGYLQIYVKDKNNYCRKENLIKAWYKTRANIYFNNIIEQYKHIINININNLRIRSMKTRWGSCNPYKSYINLNLELIKKPKIAIEYVIFHELSHLIHHNHDSKFYNYLTLHMPDWKKRKLILDS